MQATSRRSSRRRRSSRSFGSGRPRTSPRCGLWWRGCRWPSRRPPHRSEHGKMGKAGKRRVPLKHSYGSVPHALYPSVVRSLYNKNPALAIMMWGVVSVGVDDRITAGMLSKQMKRPVVACVQFLREMGRRGMLKCVYSEEGRPESSQYLVTPTLYLQADPIDKPAVYGCVPPPVFTSGTWSLPCSRTRITCRSRSNRGPHRRAPPPPPHVSQPAHRGRT